MTQVDEQMELKSPSDDDSASLLDASRQGVAETFKGDRILLAL